MILVQLLYLLSFLFDHSIPCQASTFETDEIGNIYLIQERSIEKIDTKGNFLFKNSNLDYGNITHLDLTNPFQPFIFYQEQGKVIILDNTLSQQGAPIDLFEKGLGNIECMGGARGDAFWLWDINQSELKKVDRQFNIQLTTGNLSMLLNKELHFSQIQESGNFIYAADPAHGIFVFDIYGNYKSLLPVTYEGKIVVRDDRIYYISNGQLNIIQYLNLESLSIALPVGFKGDWDFRNRTLEYISDGQLHFYRLSE
jgi:hypothetical protein